MKNRDFTKFHLLIANARDIDTIIKIFSATFFLNVLSSPHAEYRSIRWFLLSKMQVLRKCDVFLSAQDQKFGQIPRFQIAITFEQKVVQIWSTRRWKAEISYFRNFYKTKWNSTRQSGIFGPEGQEIWTWVILLMHSRSFFHFVWSDSTLSCNTF